MVTSWILVIICGLSVLCCIYAYFTAMSKTQKILHTQGGATVSEGEFAYYDSIRNVCIVGFMMSMCQLSMGKKGLMTIKTGTEKPLWAKRAFRKSVLSLALLMIFTVIATHICHGMHKIRTKLNQSKHDSHGHTYDDHRNMSQYEDPIPSKEEASKILIEAGLCDVNDSCSCYNGAP